MSKLLAPLALVALASTVLAHDGDLKLLHKQPARTGGGFRNAVRAQPRGPEDLTENERAALGGMDASGVTLLSWVTLGDFGVPSGGNGNSLWGYEAPSGRRYALMGLSTGTAFVEVTNPGNPVVVTQIAGPNSLWRDIRTYEHYAYAISEGGSGIQIFDMANIDSGTVSNLGTLNDVGTSATHTLVINEDSGYLYRAGGGSNGLRIYDLEPNPASPTYVGSWPDRYVHEASVYSYTSGPWAGREIVFACGGLNGGFTQTGLHILDVTNKANIQTLGIGFYPNAEFCHQGWLSDDLQYFYINDELYKGPQSTIVMNVADLANPTYVTTFTNGNPSVAHNLYIDQGLMYSASYKAGLRVWDLANPTSPTEIAYFDTAPEDDEPTFNGLWNNYPYFGDGIVLGSDLESGLWVWYVGTPRVTIALPTGAPTEVDPSGETIPVQLQELVAGDYQAGTAMVHYDAGAGWVSAPLNHVAGLDFTADLPAVNCGQRIAYYFSAQSTDGIVWVEPSGAPLDVYEADALGSVTTVFGDDFETNQGWTATNLGASSGDWQRGIPVNDSGWDYDPASDADGSGRCWLTQNAPGNTDVDGGAVRLTSPTLDMSSANLVRYQYFLRLTSTAGEDRLVVEANANNGSGAWGQVAVHDTDGGLGWRQHVITDADFAAAGVPLTATMRLRFTVNDDDTQTIVEAGLDAFEVLNCSGSTTSFCDASDNALAACPCANPGAPDSGCDIAQGTGGVSLAVVGQNTLATQATLSASGFPAASAATAVVIRSGSLDPSSPIVFGDGLRCVAAAGLVRLAATSSSGGSSTHVFGHGAGPGTFFYQVWFRNTPSTFCNAAAAFNLSNGQALAW